jgi:hypothetical protein
MFLFISLPYNIKQETVRNKNIGVLQRFLQNKNFHTYGNLYLKV